MTDLSLCEITGTEALFADVGHFTVRSIQISTCTVIYPAIVLAYTGQAAFLRKHNQFVSEAFFKSVPGNKNIYLSYFILYNSREPNNRKVHKR